MKNLSMNPILSSSILWVPALAVSLAIAGCGSKSTGGTGGEGGSEASSSSSSSSSSSTSASSSSSSSGGAVVGYAADAQPIFMSHCAPCHTTGDAGGSNFAAVYSDTQAAPTTAPDCTTAGSTTVGACTLVRIQDGEMPYMAGCTGDPTTDAANAACLTAAEQTTIQDWIAGGLAP